MFADIQTFRQVSDWRRGSFDFQSFLFEISDNLCCVCVCRPSTQRVYSYVHIHTLALRAALGNRDEYRLQRLAARLISP
jgi:hypothetical protein